MNCQLCMDLARIPIRAGDQGQMIGYAWCPVCAVNPIDAEIVQKDSPQAKMLLAKKQSKKK